MNNYTVPGFDEDVYFGDDDAPVLAIAQPDVIVSGWPECEMVGAKQIAEYADLGNLSAVDPPYQVSLQCNACRVRWIGCQDAAECPQCDRDCLAERATEIGKLFDAPEMAVLPLMAA